MTSPNDLVAIPRDLLDHLKARQIAFFEARLTSKEAAQEWRGAVEHIYRELLAAPIGSVVDAGAVADALDAALSDEAVRSAVRPLAKVALDATVEELRTSRGRVGEHVPAAAQQRLNALLERPKLFPERLAREIAAHDAVEEVMRDILYETLKEFSEKVNPFFADWGLPALLRRLSPFGLGGMKKGLESFRGEFDRRLEPEIRKFLQGFTKPGLKKMVEQMIAKSDEPSSIALRKRLAAWVLEQEIAALARSVDDEGVRLAEEIGLDVAAHALSSAAHRERRRASIRAAIESRTNVLLGRALEDLGVTHTPDFDAIARASWPLVRMTLSSRAFRSWFALMIEEFYDGVAGRP